MDQLEVIDRLMQMTGDWPTTLRLIEKYPVKKSEPLLVSQIEPAQLAEAPRVDLELEIQPPEKLSRKRFKIKEGSLREQLREAVEHFPDSTIDDLLRLTCREDDSKSSVSTVCKTLCDKRVMVRKKNANGVYAYRLASAPH